jgi:signal transduction histidine kinase
MRAINRDDSGGYMAALLELSRILNSSLDSHEVMQLAIDEVTEFVGAERGFLLLLEDEGRRVIARATHKIDPEELERALASREEDNRAEVSRRIVEQVMRERSAVSSLNAMEDPRFSSHTSVRLSRLRSVLCVPLLVKDRLLGIVYVDNRLKSGAFNQRHRTMIAAFANQAAIAIENARLYGHLRSSMEEKLRLQQELHVKESQRIALAEANRAKNEAIGFVAHELRNPLTVIGGSAQTLLAFDPPSVDMVGELAEMIEAESQRMMVLINEMLDTAALEAGKPLTLAARPMDLKQALEKLARAQRFYKHWKPAHVLVLEFDPELPVIRADEDKVRQIVANLLSNAIKYSPDGGEIRLSVLLKGGSVHIEVSDQGLGMNESQKAQLFSKFERLDREEIRQIPGTGLGLFLTRQLVHLHGGTIDCESEPGTGARFRVILPSRPRECEEPSKSPYAVVSAGAPRPESAIL